MELVGQKFGRLTVVRRAPQRANHVAFWHCRCACGTFGQVAQKHLRSGHTLSCGCLHEESRRVNYTGRKFGKLTVLEDGDVCRVRCACGNETNVRRELLNARKSCGCMAGGMTHGEAIRGKETKEYFAWENMKQRCLNVNHKKYDHYGGRGITVCKRWLTSYENFLADLGRAPAPHFSIDRINNDGNYTPRNVRWALMTTQASNRRVPQCA